MKRIFVFFLVIVTVASIEMCATRNAWAAGLAGLNFTTHASSNNGASPILGGTVLSTGVVSTINYNWGGGVVLNSGRSEDVVVHFYGYIKATTTGIQSFGMNADDGIKLTIGGTTIINSWVDDGGSFRTGSISMTAGQVYSVDIWYYENGGGALVNFQWLQNGAWQIVPGTNLATDSTYWAPQYSASISAGQQSRVTAAQTRAIASSSIYIDQVGDNNTVNIDQSGPKNSISGIGQQAATIQGNNNNITIRQGDLGTGKNEINLRAHGDYNTLNLNQSKTATGTSTASTNDHYQSVDVIGSYNAVTTQQTNTGGIGGHYMETTVNGNNNNVIVKQLDNGNKTMFTTTNGNSNTVTATQSGTGQHYLETTLIGNGNSATVTQSGNTANNASISITNAGGPGSVDLQQSGGQVYNITTTCVTAGGCGTVTVRQ